MLTFADGHASLCTVYSHPAARRAVNRELELGSPPLTPSLPLPAQPSPLQSISSPPTPFTFTTDAPHLLLDFLLRQKLQSKALLSENSKPGKTLQEVDQVNNANSAIIFLTNLQSVLSEWFIWSERWSRWLGWSGWSRLLIWSMLCRWSWWSR